MNRKFLFCFKLLLFFGCQQPKKEVTFSEFKNEPSNGVEVLVSTGDVFLVELIHLQTTSRLKSKTTTVFSTDVYYSTSETIQGRNLVLKYQERSSIPKYLKTQTERAPYLKGLENQLRTKKYSPQAFNYQPYQGEIPQNLEGSVVLEAVYH